MSWSKLLRDKVESFRDHSLSDERVGFIQNIASSALQLSNPSDRTHFVDNLLGKLTRETLIAKAPQRLRSKVEDANKTLVSISTLATNVRQLNVRFRSLLNIKIGVKRDFTWENQPKTLLIVIAYTAMCNYPHMALVYPLLYILSVFLVREYLKSHPRPAIRLIARKEKESSLFDFLSSSGPAPGLECLSAEIPLDQSEIASVCSDDVLDELAQANIDLESELPLKEPHSKRDILKTLSTLQVATSAFLDALDAVDRLYKEYFGFGSEINSTLTFYILSATVAFILLFGRWIPWRLLFVSGGWTVFASIHPWTQILIKSLTVERAAVPVAHEAQAVATKNPYTALNAIVQVQVNETPYLRSVQIYELQRKAPFSQSWSSTVYSSTMFLVLDMDRTSGREPESVPLLNAISPPPGYKFGEGGWVVDKNPGSYLHARGSELRHQLVINDLDKEEGWIYDKLSKEAMVGIVYEFRRRRLIRTCMRL